jgi:hypothetical protein
MIMQNSTKLTIALVWILLLFGVSNAQAVTVIFSGNTATAIQNLVVNGNLYNVQFVHDSANNIYGAPPSFDFVTESSAIAATNAMRTALDSVPAVTMVGPNSSSRFMIGYREDATQTISWMGRYDNGSWEDSEQQTDPPFEAKTYAKFTPVGGGPGTVDLSGTVKTASGTGICAMVLASGQFMFSCNPNGLFSLTDLPREPTDGTVKRQIYADGFFPETTVLPGSVDEAVVMTRSGTCPSYNQPYQPGFFPDSAGKRIDIAGKVLAQNSATPICAMVLANGQHMFSCDGSGSYALNIPLDNNGQFKLQVYADGFAPTIQKFDEFQAVNDVRMARTAECQ